MELNNIDENKPKTSIISKLIVDEVTLFLFSVEYSNGIQISIYENKAKLGSLSIAYPFGDSIESMVIFSGNNEMFASAVAQIIAKKKNKIAYCSVNLNRDSKVSLSIIKDLVDKYFEIE